LEGIGHFWSLAVEEQFYIFWPFLIFFTSSKNLFRIVVAIVVSIPLCRYLAYSVAMRVSGDSHQAGELLNFVSLFQADAFATGAAVALLPKYWPDNSKCLFWTLVILTTVLGMINLFVVFRAGNVSSRMAFLSTLGYPYLLTENHQYIWAYTLLNITTAAYICCITRSGNPLRLFEHPALVYLGRISYGMYVFHVPVLIAVREIGPIQIYSVYGMWGYVLFLAGTIGIAAASFHFLERHFLRLKARMGPLQ
jgi:peptidoglycan/LPS O-acetylase OafA/YrhL